MPPTSVTRSSKSDALSFTYADDIHSALIIGQPLDSLCISIAFSATLLSLGIGPTFLPCAEAISAPALLGKGPLLHGSYGSKTFALEAWLSV